MTKSMKLKIFVPLAVAIVCAGILGTFIYRNNFPKVPKDTAPPSTTVKQAEIKSANQKDKDNDKEKPAEESTTQTEETPTQAKSNDNQQTKTAAQAPQTTTQAPATTKHTHNYSIKGETVPPTATEDGYTIYKCSCGATTKGDWVQKTGNDLAKAKAIAEEACAWGNSYIASRGIPAYDASKGFCESTTRAVFFNSDINTVKGQIKEDIDFLIDIDGVSNASCVCYPSSTNTYYVIDYYYNFD